MERKSFSARTLDAGALKSFAHPLRLRLYQLLEERGPATATQLAALVGENTGATSYHLRELAKHLMIEVVPGMGRGKDKYWRVTPGGFAYGDALPDPEAARALEFLFERLVAQWTISEVPTEGAKPLLQRYRAATREERAWVTDVLREHCAEWFPDVKVP